MKMSAKPTAESGMQLLREPVDHQTIKAHKAKLQQDKLKRIEQRKEHEQECHARNNDKPRASLSKLSRWLHILIMEFCGPEDVIMLGAVCVSLRNSSNDEVIWRQNSYQIHGEQAHKDIW